MRGKVIALVVLVALVRITPAHAGKSWKPIKSRRRKRDHPCSCGEKPIDFIIAFCHYGSPLLMRGKARDDGTMVMRWRITPAHAGKSRTQDERLDGYEDHPCSCGEKPSGIRSGFFVEGSPLLMRGKVGSKKMSLENIRITPAHAGKSQFQTYPSRGS